MSLRWYESPRMVVLKPNTTALEAARAIENNNIGAVIVQDKGHVVGIVTDRDLTIRVLGQALDPTTATLGEVMTTPVVTLSPANTQADAVRLMRQSNIRRIPLVEDDRLVGIVTLDDMLLDEAAPLDELAMVIKGQIGRGGPAPSPRTPAEQRRAARAQETYRRLLNQVREEAELETPDQAEAALEVVVGSIVQRLTPDEGDDLIAQLPSLLQPKLRTLPRGPNKEITRQSIETKLREWLGVDASRATQILEAVGTTIAQTVSPGEIEDVRHQLPQAMRDILPAPHVKTS